MNHIRLCNGNLYFSCELYDSYFTSIQAVVLLARDDDVLIVPVQQESGGLLLKIRNARGDRVVHAAEFCQQHDLYSAQSRELEVRWQSDMGALVFRKPAV